MQLLSLIPILILFLYCLISKDLVYTGILVRLEERNRQLISKLNYVFSLAETMNSFSFTSYHKF